MIDEKKLRELANTLISEPVSRSIEEIECAGEFIKVLLDELQSLRSERTAWRVSAESAEKDAARYRAIPTLPWYVGPTYDTYNDVVTEGEYDNVGHSKASLDAAIDAAMKETP